MSLTKSKMPETMYRVSRLCRVLGNPTAYLIMRALESGSLTVNEISELTETNVNTVSSTLRHLRQIDLVRCETCGSNKAYWIKVTQVTCIFRQLEEMIDETRLVLE